eukprot:g14728.t1
MTCVSLGTCSRRTQFTSTSRACPEDSTSLRRYSGGSWTGFSGGGTQCREGCRGSCKKVEEWPLLSVLKLGRVASRMWCRPAACGFRFRQATVEWSGATCLSGGVRSCLSGLRLTNPGRRCQQPRQPRELRARFSYLYRSAGARSPRGRPQRGCTCVCTRSRCNQMN